MGTLKGSLMKLDGKVEAVQQDVKKEVQEVKDEVRGVRESFLKVKKDACGRSQSDDDSNVGEVQYA